MIFELYSDNNG